MALCNFTGSINGDHGSVFLGVLSGTEHSDGMNIRNPDIQSYRSIRHFGLRAGIFRSAERAVSLAQDFALICN